VIQHLQFGTDGIRGNVGTFPFVHTTLVDIGNAIGLWLQQKSGGHSTKIMIGMDTRQSGASVYYSLVQGLSQHKLTIVDAGVLPTPALYQFIDHDKTFDCALMISASHNPYQDNGIKLFDRSGKLSAVDEQEIVGIYENIVNRQDSELFDQFICNATIQSLFDECQRYQKNIVSFFDQNFLSGVSVVLDCAHGATYKLAPYIFKSFGANVTVINNQPNGKNINDQCGAVHPEQLQKSVVTHNADIGFAFDGDGDRVIAVNKKGELKDGDDIMALLTILDKAKNMKSIVGTVMTNAGFEEKLHHDGHKLIRTKVGDKYVVAAMRTHESWLGGETSGHVIMRDYLETGDGMFVALRVLQAVIQTKNWLLETFEKFPQILINVPVHHKKDLTQQPYCAIISQYEQMIDGGRVLVRYSGTQNLLRVMTEASEQSVALDVATQLASRLKQSLEGTGT